MRRTKWAIGLAVVLAGATGVSSAARHDEEYDLRGPAPKKGQVYSSKMVLRIKDADMEVKLGGQSLKLKQTLVATTEEEEKVLAVEGRQVTKSQARIIKDQVDITADFMGMKMSEKHSNELEGEVIISERTAEGKWKHILVDTKPTDKQKKELAKRLGPENDDELFPEGKVKVGHTWTVDAAEMKRFFGNSFTEVKGKMNQKFLKVEEAEGEECAVIESSGKIRARMKDDDGEPGLNVDLEMTTTTWRSLKTGVEVKGTFKGKIRMAGKQKIDDNEADVVIDGPIDGTSSTKLK
ncbi:MAG TPA: hypothetical protein VKE74_30115 [Gemmataceae bacterium]|nr:hypothetical protein [Gemmataceae bacterium]